MSQKCETRVIHLSKKATKLLESMVAGSNRVQGKPCGCHLCRSVRSGAAVAGLPAIRRRKSLAGQTYIQFDQAPER